jgi:hypothetical protein
MWREGRRRGMWFLWLRRDTVHGVSTQAEPKPIAVVLKTRLAISFPRRLFICYDLHRPI